VVIVDLLNCRVTILILDDIDICQYSAES